MADKKKHSSRKTLRKDEAPYARKLDDAPDDAPDDPPDDAPKGGDDKGKGGAKPDDDKAKSSGKPDDDKAKSSGKPDVDETAAKSEAKPAEEAKPEPAQPAPEPAPAAPAAATAEPVYAELPRARDIDTDVSPDSPAPAPGIAPPGDSRSFRRTGPSGEEFLLIYREHSHLITRSGIVGKHGTWSIVDYPNQGSAANAYAHKCSEYAADGFDDLN
jgi:hypothetical protein